MSRGGEWSWERWAEVGGLTGHSREPPEVVEAAQNVVGGQPGTCPKGVSRTAEKARKPANAERAFYFTLKSSKKYSKVTVDGEYLSVTPWVRKSKWAVTPALAHQAMPSGVLIGPKPAPRRARGGRPDPIQLSPKGGAGGFGDCKFTPGTYTNTLRLVVRKIVCEPQTWLQISCVFAFLKNLRD